MRDLVQHESLGERGAVRGVRLCDAILLAQSARATLLHYAKCACAEQHSHSSVARSATIRNGSSKRRGYRKGKKNRAAESSSVDRLEASEFLEISGAL